MMISEHGCNIYTMENKFYHGKYYFIEGENMSCCMIGSSNLTSSGLPDRIDHDINIREG
ncbi:phospholipase D-like domain-containing protein [Lacrimispora sp.]|uniref:phospholipase D-like domain-containing protein n=1 Tax=Lacrimispora sp. TaxID=2719234 RepID=UPI003FA596EF